jgi:predicted DNA binding CopG/RHH family protein
MSKLKKMPRFRSEKEEVDFWSTHDSTEYIDYSKSKRTFFPHLKPSTETISLRLPKSLLEHLKLLANKRDIPYQSLLKSFLADRVDEELCGKAAKKWQDQVAQSLRDLEQGKVRVFRSVKEARRHVGD